MMEYLKEEIDRAFRVLGPDIGYGQNWRDIHQWKKENRINADEERELLRYNRIESLNPKYS